MSSKSNPLRFAVGLAALCAASGALAADLMQVYRDALSYDAQYAAARATAAAGRERLPQALAGLLPSVNATGSTYWNGSHYDYRPGGSSATQSYRNRYNTNSYGASLTQPLFRWQNWVQYDQSKLQVAQAEAQFIQAKQDLILRVAQAYFDVLLAQETLKAVMAQKEAISQQLEQAKKNFEVGTATITDTHEAQSRYDLATAQEITAENDLEIKEQALQTIIGKDPGSLAGLKSRLDLSPPQPRSLSPWVEAAEKNALPVQIQQAVTEIASREISKQRAGHLPSLDIVANKGNNTTLASTTIGITETNFQNIGLQLTLPLFQGGAVLSKDREAAANYLAAKANLDGARRSAALAARQYYLGVTNGLAQVKALEAAVTSSQSSLEANKLGYEVGVRINIDVLNAEQQLTTAKKDLSKARFETLMAQLKLKATIGTLVDADLEQINGLLEPSGKQ